MRAFKKNVFLLNPIINSNQFTVSLETESMWGDMADLAKTNKDGFRIQKRKRRPTAEEEEKANEVKKKYLQACPEVKKKLEEVLNIPD